jgi:hypothetical protein
MMRVLTRHFSERHGAGISCSGSAVHLARVEPTTRFSTGGDSVKQLIQSGPFSHRQVSPKWTARAAGGAARPPKAFPQQSSFSYRETSYFRKRRPSTSAAAEWQNARPNSAGRPAGLSTSATSTSSGRVRSEKNAVPTGGAGPGETSAVHVATLTRLRMGVVLRTGFSNRQHRDSMPQRIPDHQGSRSRTTILVCRSSLGSSK